MKKADYEIMGLAHTTELKVLMQNWQRERFLLHAKLSRFKQLVEFSRERVRDWLSRSQNPYIAFSGGKDSTCVLRFVRDVRYETPAVYIDADCAFPEVSDLIDQTPNVIRYAADEPFLETLTRMRFTNGEALENETMRTTVYGPIKRLLKDYGFDGMAYGLRADESRARALHAYTRGAVFQYKRDSVWGCQPIMNWSYNDVWAFIVSENLDYCKTYEKMWAMPEKDQRISYWAGESNRTYGSFAYKLPV